MKLTPVSAIMKTFKELELDFSNTNKNVKTEELISSIKKVEPPNLASIHSVVLDLGRYVCILPYSLTCYCTKGTRYEIQSTKISLGIIPILQLMSLIYFVVPLYRYGDKPVLTDHGDALESQISITLKNAVVYLVFGKLLITIHVIWKAKSLIPEIQAELARISILTSRLCGEFTNKQIKSVTWILVAIFMFLGCWTEFKCKVDNDELHIVSLKDYPEELPKRFFAWFAHNCSRSDGFPVFELLGGISVTIADFYSNILENFIDLWSLTAAVLLHLIMGTLTSKLKNGEIRYEQEDQVLDLLDRICHYVELTNDAIYWVFASNVSITLPYQAAYIMDVFYSDTSITAVVSLAINMAFHVGILVIAANANAKSREIGCWLQSGSFDSAHNHWFDEPMSRRVAIIITRLNADAIAFRGGPFFTLTYSFLGSAISFIITYCVIIIQNQNQAT